MDALIENKAARFIPAPAGNIIASEKWGYSATVHPRASGEHLQFPFVNHLVRGSSPRQRGTLIRMLRDHGI